MMTFLKSRWFLLALRSVLAGIFLYAGAIKIVDPQAFADSIATFQILPTDFTNIFALSIPVFEVMLALMLLTGWKQRAASLGIFALTVIFAIALSQALLRGLEVDCGCFGSSDPSIVSTLKSLGRDIVLMVLAGGIYWRTFFQSHTTSASAG